jgi:hypothetical protein
MCPLPGLLFGVCPIQSNPVFAGHSSHENKFALVGATGQLPVSMEKGTMNILDVTQGTVPCGVFFSHLQIKGLP